MDRNVYNSPLVERYSGERMSYIFSDTNRHLHWRQMWVFLAEAEQSVGLNITDEQISEMKEHMLSIDYDRVEEIERITNHDVVAHLRAYAEQCPTAAPIMHLGATSSFITDNADVMIIHKATALIADHLDLLIHEMCKVAMKYKDLPCVGYTHLQPAQPTTVGKRVCMWIQDMLMDYQNLIAQYNQWTPLGCRGATGTCDSFMKLLGDASKVDAMEESIVQSMGFNQAFPISGQTYPRKQDYYLLQVLSGIAQSASKMATDIRLLASKGEIEEPFGDGQVGSSAMPYKRNPILCERICGLARYVITNVGNTAITASCQWLERSLDDSSNRRIVIPETFLAVDGILELCLKVVSGLQVHDKEIWSNLESYRVWMSVESILAHCVSNGGNRQKAHEALRQYAMDARAGGGVEAFKSSVMLDSQMHISSEEEMDAILYADNFTGLASKQVEKFVSGIINSNNRV